MTTTVISQPAVDLVQYKLDLIDLVASTNVEYLAISIGIILGLAAIASAIFYLISFKPLTKKLHDHEKTVTDLTNKIIAEREATRGRFRSLSALQQTTLHELTNKIDALKELAESRVTLLENEVGKKQAEIAKKIAALDSLHEQTRREMKIMEVMNEWTEHYLWETRGIPSNTLSTLTSCLDKANDLSRLDWLVEMILEEIEDELRVAFGENKTISKNLLSEIMRVVSNVKSKSMAESAKSNLSKIKTMLEEKITSTKG